MTFIKDWKKSCYISAIIIITYVFLFNILVQSDFNFFKNFLLILIVCIFFSSVVAYILIQVILFLETLLYGKNKQKRDSNAYKSLTLGFLPMSFVSFFLILMIFVYAVVVWAGGDPSPYHYSIFGLMSLHSSIYLLSILISLILFYKIQLKAIRKIYSHAKQIGGKVLVEIILFIIVFKLLGSLSLILIETIIALVV